jgi:proteic killer suppression protein
VITPIKHNGLKIFFDKGSAEAIQHKTRLMHQLTALDTAHHMDDMNLPGYDLHPLKGKMKERWSIKVNGNWRLTFEFHDGNVHILDYEDYH